jgi:hypothetical protein
MQRLMGLLDCLCCQLPREPAKPRRPIGKPGPVHIEPIFLQRPEARTAVGEQAVMLVEGAGLEMPVAGVAGRIADTVSGLVRPPAEVLARGDTGLLDGVTAPLRDRLDDQSRQIASLRMELGRLRKRSTQLEEKLAQAGDQKGGEG